MSAMYAMYVMYVMCVMYVMYAKRVDNHPLFFIAKENNRWSEHRLSLECVSQMAFQILKLKKDIYLYDK
jgi:hypothetical protein